jgi:hypothetical protein
MLARGAHPLTERHRLLMMMTMMMMMDATVTARELQLQLDVAQHRSPICRCFA